MSDFGNSLIGTTIAERYRVDAVIGKGGLGIVFSGLHLSLNKTVAIKVLNVQYGISTESQKRFQQEAHITSQLDHQNIVKIYDYGELSSGSSFLVLDLVKGETLEDLILVNSLTDHKRIVSIFLQVCAGLSHAHQAGVVHRDLTPANIMITKSKSGEEVVKILDFGLSRAFGAAATEGEQRLTSEGMVVGTCLYMSPEQCSDINLDSRSDIYSLGCVLYEVLTGKLPLMGQSALSTLQKQISEDPLPFAQVTGKSIPKEFEDIVFRAMKKNRTERYQSVDELADDLRRIGQTPSGWSTAVPPVPSTSADSGKKPNTETIKMAPLDGSVFESAAAAASANIEVPRPANSAVKPVLIAALIAAVVIAGMSFPLLKSANDKVAVADPSASKDPLTATGGAGAPPASAAANAAASAATPIKTNNGKWKELQKKGDKAREDGNFSDAEKNYALSLKELDDSGQETENTVSALKKMSNIYYIQNKAKEAEKVDARVNALSKKLEPANPEDTHKEVIDRLASLAQLCHNDGQCDRAEQLLKRSIAIAKKVYGPDSKQVNQRLDDLATFYLSLGEDKKADEILKSIAPKSK